MGSESAIFALQAASSLADVVGGFAAQSAARQEASALDQQAALTEQETARDVEKRKREVLAFRDAQASKFNNSGVLLEGSPLLVLQETIDLGNEELTAMMQRGNARANLLRSQAGMARTQGRNALIGGFTGAASGALNTLVQGRRFGLFGNNSKTVPQKAFLPPTFSINPALPIPERTQ